MQISWDSCNRAILTGVFLLSYPIICVVVLQYVTSSSSMFTKNDELEASISIYACNLWIPNSNPCIWSGHVL